MYPKLKLTSYHYDIIFDENAPYMKVEEFVEWIIKNNPDIGGTILFHCVPSKYNSDLEKYHISFNRGVITYNNTPDDIMKCDIYDAEADGIGDYMSYTLILDAEHLFEIESPNE